MEVANRLNSGLAMKEYNALMINLNTSHQPQVFKLHNLVVEPADHEMTQVY